MGPLEATQSVLTNFADFSGRASRSEYWWFVAAWTVFYLIILVLQKGKSKIPEIAFIVVTAIPVMSVGFRRLQDIGHSGWWSVAELLIISGITCVVLKSQPSEILEDEVSIDIGTEEALSPVFFKSSALFIIASILIIWHFSLPSEPGANQYGPNPHEVTP